ncbi:hypothetical protein C4D60_Mb00t08270 [Musa balbisiana]|uniref:NADH:quinone oxidoreductase/Mrp antiporter membrane subunit domain-containing protein n=1 Tax=Musa balbisiana TaxID=52838 RepID=A0A4S8I5Y1_MUSBA|nr:hypothetical protein C4D60_Mb00t08270 [Musa balbisiana]
MIWHVQNENFILDSTRIFMKAFHLLLFHGSFIFPECILIFGLILLLMIDSTSDQKDRPWFYFISSTKCFSLCSYLLSGYTKRDVRSNEATMKYLLMGGASSSILVHGFSWLYGSSGGEIELQEIVNECFSLCSYLLSGYTKRDVRSNEATMKYLLMGGASSSILVHGFSWLYGSSGGEIELQEIVNGLINTQMYNSPGISIALISITVGIGFKLSPAPFHQWTPDVYEGVRFVRQIPTSISISEMFGFFKTP